MENKIVIGNWEALWLLLNLICAKIFLGFPRQAAETAGTAGWILSIYILVLALAGFAIISKLYARFEGMDLMDIGQYVFGGIGRVITGLIILSVLLYTVPTVLRIFTEDMKVISFTASPISFITTLFIVGMIAAAYLGIEALIRISSIFTVAITVTYIIILISLMPNYNINNIFPIMGNGAGSIFLAGSLRVSNFTELIYLFLLAPFLKTHKNFRNVGYRALLFSGILFIVSSLAFLFVMPYPTCLERLLPVYQMTRLINYSRFIQRIESVFLVSWAMVGLIYISSGFFFIIYTFKKTFGLEYHRPLIIPFSVIIFTLSLIQPNLTSVFRFESAFFRQWSWTVTFGFTIILLIVARLIKKNSGKAQTDNEGG